MASLQQAFDPIARVLPFAQRREPGAYNDLPRARVDYDIDGEVVTAKATANTNRLRINCNLPNNYAYVLDNVFTFLKITGGLPGDADGIDNFESIAGGELDPIGTAATRFMELFANGNFITGSGEADGGKIWTPQSLSKQIFFNTQGSQMNLRVFLVDGDNSNATLAGELTYHASFLQYDIEQAYNVAVNAPLPVRLA